MYKQKALISKVTQHRGKAGLEGRNLALGLALVLTFNLVMVDLSPLLPGPQFSCEQLSHTGDNKRTDHTGDNKRTDGVGGKSEALV